MIQYHKNLFMSIIMILCFLPFLWSVAPDKDSSSSSSSISIQVSTGHPDNSKLLSSFSYSSTSSVNLNSVQSEPNILNTTTTLPLSTPSPPSTTIKSSSSSSTIINNSGFSKATDQFSSRKYNSTLNPSLSTTSTTTINNNITTLINLSQSPDSTVNSTIISSQSLSTSQQQQHHPIDTEKPSFPPQLLEFVGLLAFVVLVSVFVLATVIYGCVKVYHSRYPARITFGRKFSTFENPIYVQKASSSGEIDCSRENQAGPMAIEIYN